MAEELKKEEGLPEEREVKTVEEAPLPEDVDVSPAGGIPSESGSEGVPEGEGGVREEESPEKLMRALEAEAGEEETPSPDKSPLWLRVLPGLGILLCILGILVGLYLLWTLFHTQRTSDTMLQKPPALPKKPEASSPSREPLGAMPLEVRPEHSLVLKHFLIPLQSEGGAPVFIKASVVLYFTSQKEVLKAKKLENPLRGMIFETFKNIPFYYWRSSEGINKIKAALLKSLRERAPEGLRPSDVDVTGYILK